MTATTEIERRHWWPDIISASLMAVGLVVLVTAMVWQLGTESRWVRAVGVVAFGGATLAEYFAAARRGPEQARSATLILAMMLLLLLAGSGALERAMERL